MNNESNFFLSGHVRTVTGAHVSITDPQPQTINIMDIATGLGYTGAMGSQTPFYISLAEQATIAVDILPMGAAPRVKLATLLYNSTAAYMGSVQHSCLLFEFGELLSADQILKTCIFERYGLLNEAIKVVGAQYDRQAFQVVKRATEGAPDKRVRALTPEISKYNFLKTFKAITQEIVINEGLPYEKVYPVY